MARITAGDDVRDQNRRTCMQYREGYIHKEKKK